MTNSLTVDFNDFIEKISLNRKEEDDIKEKHNNLSEMIMNSPPEEYKIIKTLLSGSYAKHTVINEYTKNKLPDVDIIVIIQKNNKTVDEINSDFFSYFKNKKGKVTSNIRQQSNSIGLTYSNISVDVVIGIITNNQLKICSNKKHEWINSNSLKHVDYMIKKNKEFEGFSYYHLMKLFKYLNNEMIKNKVKSFTLEQLVHQCCPMPRSGLRLYQAFVETLKNMVNVSEITGIKDCCDSSKKGYDEKDIQVYKKFNEEIEKCYKLSQDAISGDRKKWNEIFGDRFPKQPDKVVKNEANYDKNQTPWCNN